MPHQHPPGRLTHWLARTLDRFAPLRAATAPAFPSPLRGGARGGGTPYVGSDSPLHPPPNPSPAPTSPSTASAPPPGRPRDYAAFAREGFMAERHPLSLRAHDRGGRRQRAAAALRRRRGNHRPPAARSPRPPQPGRQRARPAGVLVRLPARLRQRLPGSRRRRRRHPRAAHAAPRPHEGHPRRRRLARGLRLHRRRQDRAASPARPCPACAASCT